MSVLHQRLQDLNARLQALHAVLTAEGDALQKGDADPLPDCVSRKEALAQQLATDWGELSAALGLDTAASRQTVAQVLAEADAGLTATWEAIVARIDEIGRLNRLNGRLIEAQLQRTQTALQILQSAVGRGDLYGADGQGVALFDSNRHIDEA